MEKWTADEKEALNKELQARPLYLCDVEKNADCPKTYCALNYPSENPSDYCRHTTDIRFAKTDDDGNAIRILNADDL